MLTDQQHAHLKRLLKAAIDGTNWTERAHALEDAATLVGVISDRRYISAKMMKANAKNAL